MKKDMSDNWTILCVVVTIVIGLLLFFTAIFNTVQASNAHTNEARIACIKAGGVWINEVKSCAWSTTLKEEAKTDGGL